MWYGFSFLRLELDSSFSPSLAEDSPHSTSFFRLKKCVIFSAIAVTWLDPKTASLCCEALWLFNACRLTETSLRSRSGFGISWNIELATFFECLYFQLAKLNFSSHFASFKAWISSPGSVGQRSKVMPVYFTLCNWYMLTQERFAPEASNLVGR